MAGCPREGKGDGLTIAGQRLRHLVNSIAEKPYPMGRLMRLGLKERLAVALVLDRRDLFVDGEFTILQAIEYLGDDWVKTALAVQSAFDRESMGQLGSTDA